MVMYDTGMVQRRSVMVVDKAVEAPAAVLKRASSFSDWPLLACIF